MPDKNKERIALTEKLEQAKLAKIQAEYQRVYTSIRKELADFFVRYADGGITLAEATKYGRLANLMKYIEGELAKMAQMNAGSLAAHAFEVYELNYFHAGYLLETTYQKKLAFGALNREAVKAAIMNPLDKVAGLANRTQLRQAVNRAITQAIVRGESVQKAAKAVKTSMETSAYGAERIVRTETTRSMNMGTYDSMQHAASRGLPIKKQWLATLDRRTRDSHQSMDGETQELDKPFSNGLMFPGDPSGSAGEIINCRCTMIEVVEVEGLPETSRAARDSEGNYEVIPNMTYRQWLKTRVSGR
jgi:SPP1 gp7 family putative phage head morphogenesis protein